MTKIILIFGWFLAILSLEADTTSLSFEKGKLPHQLNHEKPAVLVSPKGDTMFFKTGRNLFRDQKDLKLKKVPEIFEGAGYMQLYYNKGVQSVEIFRPGIVYLLTPSLAQNREYSQAERLIRSGFSLVNGKSIEMFAGGHSTLYYKHCEQGERVSFGKWAIPILFPEKPLSECTTDPSIYIPELHNELHTIKGFEIDGIKVPKIVESTPKISFDTLPRYADENRHFSEASNIVQTSEGRLWCAFSSAVASEGTGIYSLIVVSDDNGESWTPPVMVIGREDDGPMRTDHPTLWVDPQKRLWIFWSTHSTGWIQYPHGATWAVTCEDPDKYKDVSLLNWTEPRKIVEHLHTFNKPTVLNDGSWIFPTGNWGAAIPSRPIISKDNGQSFQLGGALSLTGKTVQFGTDLANAEKVFDIDHQEIKLSNKDQVLPDTKQMFDEYMIVERLDKSLIALNRHSTSFRQYESFDGGHSWTNYQINGIPHNSARFSFLKLKSGSWLLVKHGAIDKAHKFRTHLTAFISQDEGITWQGGLLLDDRRCSYPDTFEGKNGVIFCSYEGSRAEQPEVRFARFTEADVLAGKIVSETSKLRGIINKAGGFAPTFTHKKLKDQSTHFLPPRESHDNGATLNSQRSGYFSMHNAEPIPFEKGTTLFTGHGKLFRNKDYKIFERPESLKRALFFNTNGDARTKTITCTQSGVLYMLTPTQKRNPVFGYEKGLIDQGFEKVAHQEILLFDVYIFSVNSGHYFTVHQKKLKKGETINFANWCVPLFFDYHAH